MADDIVDSLRREISETQKRREKLNALKIAFITGLLGLGSLKSEGKPAVDPQLLLLVPFVGMFFDLLILGEHFSIRRIGLFFRTECGDAGEQKWQEFVSKPQNRQRFFRYGSYGFTVMTFLAAMILLVGARKNSGTSCDAKWLGLTIPDWAVFALTFIVFVFQAWLGQKALDKLDPPAIATTKQGSCADSKPSASKE